MAEENLNTSSEEIKPPPPPAQEEEKSSGGDSDGIANCSDIETSANKIIALADVLVTTIGGAIDLQRQEGGNLELDLCYDTPSTLLHMIEEEAREIEYLAKKEIERQRVAREISPFCNRGKETPGSLQ